MIAALRTALAALTVAEQRALPVDPAQVAEARGLLHQLEERAGRLHAQVAHGPAGAVTITLASQDGQLHVTALVKR